MSFIRNQLTHTMKYILVTGGVISGVGKGVIASSFGTLLNCCSIDTTSIKIDPYINIDAGTFSPYEHGMNLSNLSLCCLLVFINLRRKFHSKMNETRCYYQRNTVLYNQMNEWHCFSIEFCYLRIESLCECIFEKDISDRIFKDFTLNSNTNKNPHIISVAMSEKEREIEERHRKDRDRDSRKMKKEYVVCTSRTYTV